MVVGITIIKVVNCILCILVAGFLDSTADKVVGWALVAVFIGSDEVYAVGCVLMSV